MTAQGLTIIVPRRIVTREDEASVTIHVANGDAFIRAVLLAAVNEDGKGVAVDTEAGE